MSWLYSQALVGAFSAAGCWDGEPSAPSNSTPTPPAFWSHGKTTAHSRLSRYGMAHRVDMLRALGNGQVPAVARFAWELLTT